MTNKLTDDTEQDAQFAASLASGTADESNVADTIVNARKSWKTVKGKSEPVWPPHLEKALVKALLQYKPQDSRYARALGRFPKRNRFISDFIFDQTGIRRTPKQVGSRLQQLKDVNCGRQLLSHVANWSLGQGPPPTIESLEAALASSADVPPREPSSPSSSAPPSPSSPFSGSMLTPLPSSLGANFSAQAPALPTPRAPRIDVYIPYDPSSKMGQTLILHPHTGRTKPIVHFAGCLTRPTGVHPREWRGPPLFSTQKCEANSGKAQGQQSHPRTIPEVLFSARGPVAARAVVNVLKSSNLPGGPSSTVVSEIYDMICSGTPSVSTLHPNALGRAASRARQPVPDPNEHEEEDCFMYSVRLVNDHFWDQMCREHALNRYMITQELIAALDMPTARAGETFLMIAYHFVPSSPAVNPTYLALSPSPAPPASPFSGSNTSGLSSRNSYTSYNASSSSSSSQGGRSGSNGGTSGYGSTLGSNLAFGYAGDYTSTASPALSTASSASSGTSRSSSVRSAAGQTSGYAAAMASLQPQLIPLPFTGVGAGAGASGPHTFSPSSSSHPVGHTPHMSTIAPSPHSYSDNFFELVSFDDQSFDGSSVLGGSPGLSPHVLARTGLTPMPFDFDYGCSVSNMQGAFSVGVDVHDLRSSMSPLSLSPISPRGDFGDLPPLMY